MGENVGAAAGLGDFARAVAHAETGQPVRDPTRLAKIVRHQDNGARGLEPQNQFFNRLGGLGVEGAGGFVHQDDFRVNGQRAGKAKPLLLADRQAQSGIVQAVFDFAPQAGFAQSAFDHGGHSRRGTLV